MKKYEQLGKKLTREEQKAVGGGFTQVANTMCACISNPTYYFPLCDVTCYDVHAQCDTVCGGASGVFDHGRCTFAPACW
jgi:hypothetical protein